MPLTPDEHRALWDRLSRMASTGATILSNATAAKRALGPPPAEPTPPPTSGYGATPMGEGVFGA